MSDNISVSIEDVLSAENHEEVGKLHILSLTEFKAALGELWDKRRGKIYILTESVLRAEIGEGNQWENPSPKIYIMLFPKLGEAEADAKAFEIAEEVGKKIIGDRFDGSKRPCIRVAGVDPKDIMNEDGTIDLQKIEEAGEKGVSAGQEEAPADKVSSKAKPNGPQTQQSSKAPIANDQIPENAPNPDDPNWKKNRHDSFDEVDPDWHKNKHASLDHGDPNWKKNQHDEMAETDTNWVKMESDGGRDEDRFPRIAADDYKALMRFYPCWERESQSLSFYRSTLYVEKNDEYLSHGLEAYEAYRAPNLSLLEKDIWVLKETARALLNHTRKHIVTPTFVPAHVTSLIGQNLLDYMAVYERLIQALRNEYIIVEAIPTTGFSLESLIPAMEAIKEKEGRCALLGEPEHFEKIPDELKLAYAGLDLSTYQGDMSLNAQTIEACKEASEEIQTPFYVFGISKRTDLPLMLDMGASLINGPALVRMTDKLRPPFNLHEDRLRGK